MFPVLSRKVSNCRSTWLTMNKVEELNLEVTMQRWQVKFHRELCFPKVKSLQTKIVNLLWRTRLKQSSLPLPSKHYPLPLHYGQYLRLWTEGSGYQSGLYYSVLFCACTVVYKQIIDATWQQNISCNSLTSIHATYKNVTLHLVTSCLKSSGLSTGFKQCFLPQSPIDNNEEDDNDDEMWHNRNLHNSASMMHQHHFMNRVHMASLTSFNFSAISLATASSESSDVTLRGSNSFPILGFLWL